LATALQTRLEIVTPVPTFVIPAPTFAISYPPQRVLPAACSAPLGLTNKITWFDKFAKINDVNLSNHVISLIFFLLSIHSI
jgi:hypothetical protein